MSDVEDASHCLFSNSYLLILHVQGSQKAINKSKYFSNIKEHEGN